MNANDAPARAIGRPDRPITAWLVAVMAASVALRVHSLGSEALWLDEAYSANFAQLPLRELVTRLGREATPPLYYVLLGGWTRLFGASETAVRALSALFSISGVGLIVTFVARCASWRAAAIAGSMAAFAPLHVYYAQEARMYALLALLAILLVLLAARALERPSVPVLIASGVVSLAALWTHNVALWLVAGVNIAFLSISRSREVRARWFVAQGLAALAYLPWLFVLLGQVQKQGEVLAWFVEHWRAKSWPAHLLDSVASFTLGPFPGYLAISGPLRGEILIAAMAAAGAVYGAMRMRGRADVRLVSIAFVIAMALALTYSALFQPVHIPGRTDQALLPLFLILLALGIDGIRPKAGGYFWVALFATGALVVLVPYYGNGAKSASRGWLRALEVEARAGDIVITTGLTYSEAEYYLRRWQLPVRLESFPQQVAGHPGYVNYEAFRVAHEQLSADARTIGALCVETLARGHRAFVVLVPPGDVHRVLVDELQRELGSPQTIGGAFAQAGMGGPVHLLRFQR